MVCNVPVSCIANGDRNQLGRGITVTQKPIFFLNKQLNMYGHPIQKMLELSNNQPIFLVKDIMRNVSLKSCFEFEPAFFRGNVI